MPLGSLTKGSKTRNIFWSLHLSPMPLRDWERGPLQPHFRTQRSSLNLPVGLSSAALAPKQTGAIGGTIGYFAPDWLFSIVTAALGVMPCSFWHQTPKLCVSLYSFCDSGVPFDSL